MPCRGAQDVSANVHAGVLTLSVASAELCMDTLYRGASPAAITRLTNTAPVCLFGHVARYPTGCTAVAVEKFGRWSTSPQLHRTQCCPSQWHSIIMFRPPHFKHPRGRLLVDVCSSCKLCPYTSFRIDISTTQTTVTGAA